MTLSAHEFSFPVAGKNLIRKQKRLTVSQPEARVYIPLGGSEDNNLVSLSHPWKGFTCRVGYQQPDRCSMQAWRPRAHTADIATSTATLLIQTPHHSILSLHEPTVRTTWAKWLQLSPTLMTATKLSQISRRTFLNTVVSYLKQQIMIIHSNIDNISDPNT